MTESKGNKKVVKIDAPASKKSDSNKSEAVWTPTPEAKSKATTLRIVSWALWIIAIAIEVATIVWIVPQAAEKLWLLLVMLIPIAALAITANLLWKKANRLDPASKKNAFKFFVQNQLGAIMTIIAFLPLIILVLLDKNMDGKQKGIVAGIAAVAMIAIATLTGTEWDGGPSQEQYAEEENIMQLLTGKDEVFWVKGGSVFHVCAEVPDVNKESKDGQIYQGTVAAAHEAGKDRLTSKWESEATKHCGYSLEDVAKVKEGLAAISESDTSENDTSGSESDEEETAGSETPENDDLVDGEDED